MVCRTKENAHDPLLVPALLPRAEQPCGQHPVPLYRMLTRSASDEHRQRRTARDARSLDASTTPYGRSLCNAFPSNLHLLSHGRAEAHSSLARAEIWRVLDSKRLDSLSASHMLTTPRDIIQLTIGP